MLYEDLLLQINEQDDEQKIDDLYNNFSLKTIEILINVNYGGLKISGEACELYLKLTNIKIDDEYISGRLRIDTDLINCVKKIHKKIFDETQIPKRKNTGRGRGSSDNMSNRNKFENIHNYPEFDIEIEKIPYGVEYHINDYDGLETLYIDFNKTFAIIVSKALQLNMGQAKFTKFISFLHDSMKNESEKFECSLFL
jgi:hypothetical protein